MIRVNRGPEPADLAPLRKTKLEGLRALRRTPVSDDIDGYRVVAPALWKAQHFKCCYCEQKIQMSYNDVEHYRPKASADRRPGCMLTHGYWWLAFTWENLLYSCAGCNRSAKKTKFPMNHGAVSLVAEAIAPGAEQPLLLDPGSPINPVEHIVFVLETIGPIGSQPQWWARPRNGSPHGSMTIEVCGLNHSEQRELRSDYFETTIRPKVKALNDAIISGEYKAVLQEHAIALSLLDPKLPYVGFAYDALFSNIPDARLQTILSIGWPTPSQIG